MCEGYYKLRHTFQNLQLLDSFQRKEKVYLVYFPHFKQTYRCFIPTIQTLSLLPRGGGGLRFSPTPHMLTLSRDQIIAAVG